MCDYSLEGIQNRLAIEGERLLLYQFYTGCKGFIGETDQKRLLAESVIPSLPARIVAFLSDLWRKVSDPERDEEISLRLPAVCLPHGATLKVISSQSACELQNAANAIAGKTVKLVQITAEPFRFRDAIEYARGKPMLLQDLPTGMVVEVISLNLSVDEKREPQSARAHGASSHR